MNLSHNFMSMIVVVLGTLLFVALLTPVAFAALVAFFNVVGLLSRVCLHISYFIFHISYLNFLRRVALRQKPFFKGPSGKKLNYSIQLNLNMTRIKKTIP